MCVGKRELYCTWRRLRVTWAELAEISIAPTKARVRTVAGAVQRINVADLENAEETRSALEVSRRRLAETGCGRASAILSICEFLPTAGAPHARLR